MLAELAGAPLYFVHVRAKQAARADRRPATRGRTSSARPARNTSICRWKRTWGHRASKAPSGFAPRPCGHGPRLERYSEILHMVVKEAANGRDSATGKRILDLASRYKGLRHPNRSEAPAFKAELKDIAGSADLIARGLDAYRAGPAAPHRPWRCIICWNASTTSSATGGSPPATSTTGAFSTSTRWLDCGSRMPAPSRRCMAWSNG